MTRFMYDSQWGWADDVWTELNVLPSMPIIYEPQKKVLFLIMWNMIKWSYFPKKLLFIFYRQKLGTNQRNRQPTEAEIQEESHYKAALKLSNTPPYYRSSIAAETPLENEYAYVEDFLPPPPAADGVPMNKIISSQQLQYPNSTANHYGALGLLSKQSSMHPMLQGQNSGCERVPRHYFQPDPDMATNGSGYSHHVFADGHNPRPLSPLHSVPPPPSQMLKYPPS